MKTNKMKKILIALDYNPKAQKVAELEDIIMGSVTEKVLHHTSIPLLIIPTKQHK
jgi:hypothetical protein